MPLSERLSVVDITESAVAANTDLRMTFSFNLEEFFLKMLSGT